MSLTWIAPFPRLRFRIKYGYWCKHERWLPGYGSRADGWWTVDTGFRQVRHCADCEWADFR